jgi:hypothetical protein
MRRLREWWARYQHRRTMRRLRWHMAALGHPLDGLTDDEIEAGVLRAREAVKAHGASARGVAEGMETLGRDWHRYAMASRVKGIIEGNP